MKRFGLMLLLLLLGSGSSSPALAEGNEPPKRESAATDPSSGLTSGSGASGEKGDEIVVHTQKAMEELRAAVEELRKRSDKASGEARDTFERQLRMLQEEQKKLEKRFLELQAATARQWKELLEEIDRAVEEYDRPAPQPRNDTI